MTIDERLEKLTERHEALAQSMELANHEWNTRFDKLLSLTEQNTEQIASLFQIAKIQETRIQRIEGRA